MLNLAFWPERYFTLENNCFAYYMDDTKADLKGMYRLGKDDTISTKEGVLTLTSTFYKTFDQFGGGSVQKLNMKFGEQKNHDRWYKTLRTIIKYTKDSTHHIGRCACGNMEWTVFGKCLAECSCHCSQCSYFQGASPMAMFAPSNLTLTKGNDSIQTSKTSQPNSSTLRCFCKDCHTFCFANFPAYNTVGTPFDLLCTQGVPPALSRSRPKFHIHYAVKREAAHDSQLKYFDLPSIFGGSGNLVNNAGDFVGNDSHGDVKQHEEKEDKQLKKAQQHAVAVPQKEDGSRQLALVTIGYQEVGLEVCKQLAASGYRVMLCGPNEEAAEKAAQEVRTTAGEEEVHVEALVLDITSADSVSSAVELLASQHEHLDVLVNMAAGGDGEGAGGQGSLDAAKDSLELHVFSAWRVTQAFAGLLKTADPGARVVMAANGNELSTMAAHALTVQFARELKDKAVMVNSTCPSAEKGVSESAAGVVWAATLAPGGPTGGCFRDGKPLGDF